MVDHSYVAYNQSRDLQRKQQNIADGIIVSDSESSEDEENAWNPGEDQLSEVCRSLLKKKRAAIKRKAVRAI